uniref:SFRICE_035236 n=1 Tax=Spodoptera frugiperda TaxID=7108 RepID=A0A2H1X171_SPOFR
MKNQIKNIFYNLYHTISSRPIASQPMDAVPQFNTKIIRIFSCVVYKHTSSHKHDTQPRNNKELLRVGIELATRFTAASCPATAPTVQSNVVSYFSNVGRGADITWLLTDIGYDSHQRSHVICVAEKGSTATPTNRSATAKDTMNKLVTLRSFEEHSTAAITRQLPVKNHKYNL